MEENETPETPNVETPNVETPSTTNSGGEGAGTPETPQTPEPPSAPETPAEPVIPEGYVPATEVESARAEADAVRTAAEEARTAAETARAEAEAARTAAEARARAAEIREAARELNFQDPSDAERFIGSDVTDFRGALAEVLKTKGYLAKPAEAPPVTPTSPTNPQRTAALTLDAIKLMTPQQVSQNWPAVQAALKLAGK